jgi:hypothetical protein
MSVNARCIVNKTYNLRWPWRRVNNFTNQPEPLFRKA